MYPNVPKSHFDRETQFDMKTHSPITPDYSWLLLITPDYPDYSWLFPLLIG